VKSRPPLFMADKPNPSLSPLGTHLPALLAMVRQIEGPVLELGVGCYSTVLLHEVCKGRLLVTAECSGQRQWMRKFEYLETENHQFLVYPGWDQCPLLDLDWGVVLVDQAARFGRKYTIERLANKAKVIVVHDTEMAEYYDLVDTLEAFKHRRDDYKFSPKTTVLSNHVEIPRWGSALMDLS